MERKNILELPKRLHHDPLHDLHTTLYTTLRPSTPPYDPLHLHMTLYTTIRPSKLPSTLPYDPLHQYTALYTTIQPSSPAERGRAPPYILHQSTMQAGPRSGLTTVSTGDNNVAMFVVPLVVLLKMEGLFSYQFITPLLCHVLMGCRDQRLVPLPGLFG